MRERWKDGQKLRQFERDTHGRIEIGTDGVRKRDTDRPIEKQRQRDRQV